MAGVGGYMRPNQPAATSGPGAMSQRTDGGPGETATQAARYLSGGGDYGESKFLNDVAGQAPLAAAPQTPPVVPFDAPTAYPEQPVTAGAVHGPGPGPEVLVQPQREDTVAQVIQAAYDRYPSAQLRVMVQKLRAEGRLP